MALTLRATKGAKLTNTEADANLSGLASGSNMTLPFNIGSGKFFVDATGNVGVGTETPTSAVGATRVLEIEATADVSLSLSKTTAPAQKYELFLGSDEALSFRDSTANVVRAVITSGGYFKVSNDGTYYLSTGAYHESRSDAANSRALLISHTHATTPNGVDVAFVGGAPDNNTQYFLNCADNVTARCLIYSDGDLQNHDNSYGAISGRFFKQDEQIVLSQWEDVKALARLVKKYRMRSDVVAYGDRAPVQLGLIAEDVLPISPGLVRPFRNGLRKDYSLQYSILYMKGFKALGEVMERQERSESRLTRVEQALGIV